MAMRLQIFLIFAVLALVLLAPVGSSMQVAPQDDWRMETFNSPKLNLAEADKNVHPGNSVILPSPIFSVFGSFSIQGCDALPTLLYNTGVLPSIINDISTIDSQGRLLLSISTTDSSCPFNKCGRIDSVSPNGVRNWAIALPTFFGGPYLGQNDRVYIIGDLSSPSSPTILAYDDNGTAVPGWPVSFAENSLFSGPIVPDKSTGIVYVATRGEFFITTTVIAALNPGGSVKWQQAFEAGTGHIIAQGTADDIYAIRQFNGILTRYDHLTGSAVCTVPLGVGLDINTTSPLRQVYDPSKILGSPDGVFIIRNHNTIEIIDGSCTSTPIYTSAQGNLAMMGYDQGKVFAIENFDNFDTSVRRLVAISKTGTLLWRNPEIASPRVSVVKNGIVYVSGNHITDNFNPKLFLVNATTGQIITAIGNSTVGSTGVSLGRNVGAADDGTIYFKAAIGPFDPDKIYKYKPCISVPCSLICDASVAEIGAAGASVQFNATAMAANCAGSLTYDWDFGDGSPHSTIQNPMHTYATANTYNWTLTVRVSGASSCVKTRQIVIQACKTPVIAFQPKDQTVTINQRGFVDVGIDAIASGPGAKQYQWYIGQSGDTSTPITGATSASHLTDPLVSTTKYWVQVKDACGASVNSRTATITVLSAALSGRVGIWDGAEFWPLDGPGLSGLEVGITVTAIQIDQSGRAIGSVKPSVQASNAEYQFDQLPTGMYRLMATIKYKENVTVNNTNVASCINDELLGKFGFGGCGGGTLSKTTTVTTQEIVFVPASKSFDIRLPIPIVMVHGIYSCYSKWYADPKLHLSDETSHWDNFARARGFITLTPNYHFDIGDVDRELAAAKEVSDHVESLFRSLMQQAGGMRYPGWAYIGHSEGGMIGRILTSSTGSGGPLVGKLRQLFLLGTPNSGSVSSNGVVAGLFVCLPYLGQLQMQSGFNKRYPDFGQKRIRVFAGTNCFSCISGEGESDEIVPVDSAFHIYRLDGTAPTSLNGEKVFYTHAELGDPVSLDILAFKILPFTQKLSKIPMF